MDAVYIVATSNHTQKDSFLVLFKEVPKTFICKLYLSLVLRFCDVLVINIIALW